MVKRDAGRQHEGRRDVARTVGIVVLGHNRELERNAVAGGGVRRRAGDRDGEILGGAGAGRCDHQQTEREQADAGDAHRSMAGHVS